MDKVVGLLLLSMLLLTGCANVTDVQKSVSENNRRVDFLKESYKVNITPAKEVEEVLLTSIYTGVVSDKLSEILNTLSTIDDLERGVTTIHASLNAYVVHNNSLAEVDKTIPNLSIVDMIKGGTDVYYFFDDTTGKLEQLFVLRSKNGKIYKLSLLWLGGVCCEIK